MRSSASLIVPESENQSIQGLLDALSEFSLRVPSLDHFRSTSAISRIFLCALWDLRPRSFSSGELYDRSLLSEALKDRKTAIGAIGTVFKSEPDGRKASSANRFFILGDDTLDLARDFISNPEFLFDSERSLEILKSHGMSFETSRLSSISPIEEFLSARTLILTNVLNNFLSRVLEEKFEDTPSLDSLIFDEEDLEDYGARDDTTA